MPSYQNTIQSHWTAKQKVPPSPKSSGLKMASNSKPSPARIRCFFPPVIYSSLKSFIRDVKAMQVSTTAKPKMNSEQREVEMRHYKLPVGLNHFKAGGRREVEEKKKRGKYVFFCRELERDSDFWQ